MSYNSGSTNDVNEYDGMNYNQQIREAAERQAAEQAQAAQEEAARKASAENEARTSTPNDPYAVGQGTGNALQNLFRRGGKSRRSRRSKRSKRSKRTKRTRRTRRR